MEINIEWHKKNKMPKNATIEQKIKWHEEHARHCCCRDSKKHLLQLKKKIPLTVKNHQVVARNSQKHKAWALEAAKEARKVLLIFEKENPKDNRPRLAIEAIKAWATGKRELDMKEVRQLSLNAHAAAREAKTSVACFAARTAGHAIATWHVPTHALGASWYAEKAKTKKKSHAALRYVIKNFPKISKLKPWQNNLDQKVKQYINKQEPLQKKIILALRKIFFETIKNCEEKFNWGVISLDKNRFYLAGLKEKVHVGFAVSGLSKKEIEEFEGSGKTMRHIKIKSIESIDKKKIINLIKMVHKKSKCQAC